MTTATKPSAADALALAGRILLAARDAAGLRALLVEHLMHKRDAVLELMKSGQLPAGSRAGAASANQAISSFSVASATQLSCPSG